MRALVCVIAFFWVSVAVAAAPKPELVILTYDSMVAKGGLGEAIFPLFEKSCDCKVKTLASGDGGQMVSRLELDAKRGKSSAHVVFGIDQFQWHRARKHLEKWEAAPQGYDALPAEVKVEPGFMPFDHGIFAFMADTYALRDAGLPVPKSLSDLKDAKWKRKIILEDPRTSTPGLGFLLYTRELHKADFKEFWRAFRGQWLTLAPGWDGAYGLFLKKEAPLVWSYTTSQAYHAKHGDTEGRYRAVVFEEGNPVQVEGAAIIKGAPKTDLARRFLEFLISKEAQSAIPEANWMLPVSPAAEVPASFKALPKARKLLRLEAEPGATDRALKEWSQVVEGGA